MRTMVLEHRKIHLDHRNGENVGKYYSTMEHLGKEMEMNMEQDE